MPDRVTVMIVDDQAPVPRRGAGGGRPHRRASSWSPRSTSGEDAVAASAEPRPDLVLMDINMGELDGIEATRLITARGPATKVILVSTYELEDLPPTARHQRRRRLCQQGRAVATSRAAAVGGGWRPALATRADSVLALGVPIAHPADSGNVPRTVVPSPGR